MKQLTTILAITLIAFLDSFAQTNTWTLDPSHTNIKFNIQHMVISEVTGYFKKYEGKAVTNGDNFENAQIEFSAEVASVNTDNEKRDGHLQGDDFFSSAKFPKITFKGKSFKKVGENQYKLVGDLTIRDVTKEVELDATYGGTAAAWGMTKAGFKLKGKINRFDYGMKWNAKTDSGGLVAGEMVEIECNVELNKQKQ